MALTGWAVDELKSDAEVIRQSIGSLIGSAGGLVAAGGLELKQKGTPNMSVQIKGGTPAEGGLWIPGYTTSTGPYYFQNSATYEQVIQASGAEPRVDTIVARMYDNAVDSSGKTEPVFEALKGVEASGTTLGNKKGIAAVPKNCYVLGYVFVEKLATSIVTADIENVATAFGIGVSAWKPLESLNSKLEAVGTPEARLENGGSSLRFRGGVKVKTGQTLLHTDTVCTIPAALLPKVGVQALVFGLSAAAAFNAVRLLTAEAGGAIKFSAEGSSTIATEGNSISLECAPVPLD